MAGRVADKVAVVTGVALSIGRGCAQMLARERAQVVIGDLRAADPAPSSLSCLKG